MTYRFSPLFLSVLMTAVSGASLAAEPVICKGMSEANCAAEASCRWIDPYQRSDGKQVSGYCRSVGKRTGQQDAATEDKKSDS